LKWSKDITKETKKSVYFTKGTIFHLWHGILKNRGYGQYRDIISKYKFDPAKDIKKDANGCWAWSQDKPGLRKALKEYFYARNEDGFFVMSKINLFLDNFREIISRIGYRIKDNFLKFRHNLYLKFDRGLGLFGFFLRKYSPDIYPKLKKNGDGPERISSKKWFCRRAVR
jgi:hypothetical protein